MKSFPLLDTSVFLQQNLKLKLLESACVVAFRRQLQDSDGDEELKEAFEVLDKDQNGFISPTEVDYSDHLIPNYSQLLLTFFLFVCAAEDSDDQSWGEDD